VLAHHLVEDGAFGLAGRMAAARGDGIAPSRSSSICRAPWSGRASRSLSVPDQTGYLHRVRFHHFDQADRVR
jgi:hypothetical protein